jgi:tetratricopeptide (TPR) repeat protein
VTQRHAVGTIGLVPAPSSRLNELLSAAEEHLDDRIELAFEIADAYYRAGDSANAMHWLQVPLEGDQLDQAMARAEIAKIHFDAGEDDLAAAQLDQIRRLPDQDPTAFGYVADLLVARDDSQGAARWFDMAAARLTEDDLAAAVQYGPLSTGGYILVQRRKFRQRLGAPPDRFDALVKESPLGKSGAAMPLASEALGSDHANRAALIRVLVWREHDFGEAQRRWPELVAGAADHRTYRTTLELQLRDSKVSGQRVMLIPALADDLAAFAASRGVTPLDDGVRREYLDQRVATATPWPPGRNDRCWCGSGAKYKNCCLRAS